jgi:hypothetical protein
LPSLGVFFLVLPPTCLVHICTLQIATDRNLKGSGSAELVVFSQPLGSGTGVYLSGTVSGTVSAYCMP